MADTTDPGAGIGFWPQVWRENGGELVVSASYVLAWLFAPWLSDDALLAMLVAVALQFFMVTPLLGAVTPRGFRAIFWCLFGHAAMLFLIAWIASSGARHDPDWWAVLMVQAPLVVRNLERLRRPPDAPAFLWHEALGPWFLLIPVGLAAGLLAAVLPDLGLAGREITFQVQPPLQTEELKFGLMAGIAYFLIFSIARTGWTRLGGEPQRRKDVTPAMVRRWREEWLRSRRR